MHLNPCLCAVLIVCLAAAPWPPISPRYANRACHIKNTPLPAKFTMLEEDLLPSVPLGAAGGFGLVHLQVCVCACCCWEEGAGVKEQGRRCGEGAQERQGLPSRGAWMQVCKVECGRVA